MSSTTEAVAFQNISATTAPFQLHGGRYSAAAVATWGGGSAKLQILGPDGATYLSVASTTDFSANGFATVDLPPGQYRFTIATATAVYCEVAQVENS
jgi:hypothetical protein